MKSMLNRRKSKVGQILYMLKIIHLQKLNVVETSMEHSNQKVNGRCIFEAYSMTVFVL